MRALLPLLLLLPLATPGCYNGKLIATMTPTERAVMERARYWANLPFGEKVRTNLVGKHIDEVGTLLGKPHQFFQREDGLRVYFYEFSEQDVEHRTVITPFFGSAIATTRTIDHSYTCSVQFIVDRSSIIQDMRWHGVRCPLDEP
jgi:hypothetical protein